VSPIVKGTTGNMSSRMQKLLHTQVQTTNFWKINENHHHSSSGNSGSKSASWLDSANPETTSIVSYLLKNRGRVVTCQDFISAIKEFKVST